MSKFMLPPGVGIAASLPRRSLLTRRGRGGSGLERLQRLLHLRSERVCRRQLEELLVRGDRARIVPRRLRRLAELDLDGRVLRRQRGELLVRLLRVLLRLLV